ncbi:MAG: response regulator, partial [Lachnospiraceae bacterium]|nr:response regulator [Lachnospiraceae bacterium]
ETFTRENVVRSLQRHQTFTMTFRLLFADGPAYVHLKATQMIGKDDRHIVIGISSVDEQMKTREAYENAHHSSITFSRIAQALAEDYISIYYVNLATDHFIEYSSDDAYKGLKLETAGDDFFTKSRENVRRVMYAEDQERFLAVFTKENLLQELERSGMFTIKYRLLFDEVPAYVSMKVTLMEDHEGQHLVIGINSIDVQMKREHEYQQRIAGAREKAKNDFLANMSHDIRTPMNAIVGYTNIANSHLDDPALVKDSLEKIGSSSHFLLSLINDILDMSKIESGKMQLSRGRCDLAGIFRRIEDITALQAKNKSLRITYDKSSVHHFLVCGDELRIEQVLINIISNAIKYTPKGGEVWLQAQEEELPDEGWYRYRFVIRDTGMGISEEYLPYLFESFTREQKTTINKIQGTGLGLAITARIVELMGGTISVRSKVGEGSEFTVELELETLQDTQEERTRESAGKDENAPAASGDRYLEEISLTGKRVLLVEDNEINAEIASLILEEYGMEVYHSENGRAGVEQVTEMEEGFFDAVLMDIQMPLMNGYEATKAIRSLDGAYYRRLPIIAMSANAYDEDVAASLSCGMNAHLAKPFDPDILIATLRGCM